VGERVLGLGSLAAQVPITVLPRALWGCCVLSQAEELTPFEPDEHSPWLQELAGSTAVVRTSTSLTWLASVHLHSRRISADLLNHLRGEAPTTAWARILRENHCAHDGKRPPRRLHDGELLKPR
jgi:hypothetical protein